MSERVTCVRCRRPMPRCVCGVGGVVDNRTGVTILQHPGERHHAFNTARLARAALRNVALHVLWPDADRLLRHDRPIPPGAALLYPRHDAVDLEELPPDRRPAHLVVIDGTWPQARTVYRDNPWLEALPHVRLSPAAPSRYRIRREPAADYVSTIESIALALAVLEPETPGLDRLLDGFLEMVDTQADQTVERVRRQKVRTRPGLLERIATEWDQVVVGYAESVGLHGRDGPPILIQWAAIRPSTGAVFEARIAIDCPPDFVGAGAPGLTTRQLENTGLGPQADTREAFVERWTAFSGPDDRVATWSPRAAALLQETIGRQVETISIRSAYGNIRRGELGYLDQITTREGCDVVPVPVDGRAGERLGHAVALARWLRERHLAAELLPG